jgi:selenide,water dikinase
MTDVTGFGLLGHGLEMARASGLGLTVDVAKVPLLAEAATLAQQGFVTGASARNWSSYGASVVLPTELPVWQRQILTDPQTSGGLLLACAESAAEALVGRIIDAGYPLARIVGSASAGEPQVLVR